MIDRSRTPGEDRFWELAEPLLERAGVTRSTMMGFPCLRLDGDYFASCDHRNGDLIVKLDAGAVTALVAAGKAEPFAPSGRPFREWASISFRRRRSWESLLEKALACAVERTRTARRRATRRS